MEFSRGGYVKLLRVKTVNYSELNFSQNMSNFKFHLTEQFTVRESQNWSTCEFYEDRNNPRTDFEALKLLGQIFGSNPLSSDHSHTISSRREKKGGIMRGSFDVWICD